MCGILGFIGKSKCLELTQKFITTLFKKTQVRGVDASGFYCASGFDKKEVYFYKLPEPSTVFVNCDAYKNLWKNDLNLGIFHCRAATQGVGVPADNKNNHPFVSEDYQKAVIHNGFINKAEYKQLKTVFETNTDCDSEIVLRILEQKGNVEDNLSDFLSFTEKSAYAVAFAEIDENIRSLTLLRNCQRPMFIVDLFEHLGQFFFCSTIEILFETIIEIEEFKNIPFGISILKEGTILNIRHDIASKISVMSFDTHVTNQNVRKNLAFQKLQKPINKAFSAPISFDIDKESITENENVMEKLEQMILIYNKKRNKAGQDGPNNAISQCARVLQNLLQKEQL